SAYALASDGTLSTLGAMPTASGANTVALTVEPSGRFLYAANYGAASLTAFAIDGASGALSNLGTYPSGSLPYALAVEASGRFLYVANDNPSGTVTGFSIDAG